jgi:hypothetical protein
MNKFLKPIRFTVWLTGILVIINSSCGQGKKDKKTSHSCNKQITPKALESLFVEKYYYDDISSNKFLILSDPENNYRFNRSIKSIRETISEVSIKFDEEIEENIFVNSFDFDKNNNLIQKNVEKIGGTIELPNESYIKQNISCFYTYDVNSFLINKIIKTKRGLNKNNEPDIEQWKYLYNDKNKVIKEIYNSPFNDSTVIKYNYSTNSLNEAFVYNTKGERTLNVMFTYNDYNNSVIVRTTGKRWNSDVLDEIFGKSEIVFYFNDSCQLKLVTRVSSSGTIQEGYRKEYEKLQLNNLGDPESIITFSVKNLKNNDLTYKDEDKFANKEDWTKKYFEYKYDINNNWIYKKEGSKVFRRVIAYR